LNRFDRINLASRAFCIAAIFGLGLLAADTVALQGTLLLAAIAAAAGGLSLQVPSQQGWIAVAEALIVGLLLALLIPSGAGLLLLPYLAVPALLAGVSRGAGLAFLVVLGELAVVSLALLPFSGEEIAERASVAAPWFLTAIGAGALGSWLRQISLVGQSQQQTDSYESARRLLAQLRTVARRLSAGLEPVSLGEQLLTFVHDRTGDERSTVFVRTEGGRLTPLAHRGSTEDAILSVADPVVERCWTEMEPAHADLEAHGDGAMHRRALPLRVGNRMLGVVLSDSRDAVEQEMMSSLMVGVDEHSLRLDTALTFDEIRNIAAIEERQRLAREIHDGVAQEVASLGYLVDDLAAEATDPEVERRLRDLRVELTKVVSDLRLSIFDLRSQVNPSAGLGAALSEYVRRVGSRSDLTVHLTLDEAADRLRSDVESETLRIAQEAITNARKHSCASNLWVDCHVHPPHVKLVVRDDGAGLGGQRDDSYGLRIMRERAERIGANLEIRDNSGTAGQGTCVTLTLGDPATAVTPQADSGERVHGRL
jgi:signal transduction histidine kinase